MDIPDAIQSKAKSELLEKMDHRLVPGDTTWVDIYWRMYGKPDGSWGGLNQEAVVNNDEIQICTIATSSRLEIIYHHHIIVSAARHPIHTSPTASAMGRWPMMAE
jgi:hypothetical protein